MLADRFGRIATDLRVSLTDRCNLRCAYCMPPEGLDWLPAPEQLTDDEVVRLIRVGGGQPVESLGRHAVSAPQVAPVGERYAQVGGDPPEGVSQHRPSLRGTARVHWCA